MNSRLPLWCLILSACVGTALALRAQVQVSITGSIAERFSTNPPSQTWSTLSVSGAAVTWNNAAAMDSAIQAINPTNISIRIAETNVAAEYSLATWNSVSDVLQTRPTGNSGTLLMVTLTNVTGHTITNFDIQYELLTSGTPNSEEVYGHRLYYSTRGVPGSWNVLGTFSNVGQQSLSIAMPLIPWQASNVMYVLFADDNGAGFTDRAYQIDNFVITNVVSSAVTCLTITKHPTNAFAFEHSPVNFSLVATGTPQAIQWYRRDNGGGFFAIAGANSNIYAIGSAIYPDDNGAEFIATIRNSLCAVTSAIVNLIVEADTSAPLPFRAVGADKLNEITLTCSEPLDPASVTIDKFVLFEAGSDFGDSSYSIISATLTNGTNVFLVTTARLPKMNYSLRVVGLVDTAFNHNAMSGPTVLPVHSTVKLIGFDTNNTWHYDLNSGDRTGTGWEQVAFDDSAWPSGPAGLGHDVSVNAIPIRTPIPYATNGVPAYFRKHFNFPGRTTNVMLTLRTLAEDGAIFFINGQEVLRDNVATNAVLGFNTRSLTAQQDPTSVAGPFGIPTASLVTGDNVIAAVVVQSSSTSTDVEFAAELVAEIQELETGPARIMSHPQSLTVNEGRPSALIVAASGEQPTAYQWRREGTNIPGAFFASLVIEQASRFDEGNYDVVVANSLGAQTSSVARLTVIPDTTPPTVFSAVGEADLQAITITFSEPLELLLATQLGCYAVSGGSGSVSVLSATQTSANTVRLTTARRSVGITYVLQLSFLTDLFGNEIAADTKTPLRTESTLLPSGATWRYFAAGSAPGLDWMNPDFNDSLWSSGPALFDGKRGGNVSPACRVEVSGEAVGTCITISNAANSAQIASAYFRTHFQFNASTSNILLRLRALVDDGAVFYLNGAEVFRLRMPPPPTVVSYDTLATVVVNLGAWEGPFEIPTTNLVVGDNVLAVELHQSSLTSSDMSLAASLASAVPPVPADLQTLLTAPASVSLRQPLAVTWSVTNAGPGVADPTWTDRFYLSTDPVLDAQDILVGSFAHTVTLPSSASYTQTGSLTIPTIAPGNYHLLLHSDADQTVYEVNDTNNISVSQISINAADLAPLTFSSPLSAVSQQTITVGWTVTNRGSGLAVGSWIDDVYFSTNSSFDASDILLSSSLRSGDLQAGSRYSNSVSVGLPSINAGNYFLIFRTDAAGNVGVGPSARSRWRRERRATTSGRASRSGTGIGKRRG